MSFSKVSMMCLNDEPMPCCKVIELTGSVDTNSEHGIEVPLDKIVDGTGSSERVGNLLRIVRIRMFVSVLISYAWETVWYSIPLEQRKFKGEMDVRLQVFLAGGQALSPLDGFYDHIFPTEDDTPSSQGLPLGIPAPLRSYTSFGRMPFEMLLDDYVWCAGERGGRRYDHDNSDRTPIRLMFPVDQYFDTLHYDVDDVNRIRLYIRLSSFMDVKGAPGNAVRINYVTKIDYIDQ